MKLLVAFFILVSSAFADYVSTPITRYYEFSHTTGWETYYGGPGYDPVHTFSDFTIAVNMSIFEYSSPIQELTFNSDQLVNCQAESGAQCESVTLKQVEGSSGSDFFVTLYSLTTYGASITDVYDFHNWVPYYTAFWTDPLNFGYVTYPERGYDLEVWEANVTNTPEPGTLFAGAVAFLLLLFRQYWRVQI